MGIARFYSCIPIVRTYINGHLLNFGKELYKAILQDPPRWLALSLPLECTPIFKEAMVHIVGEVSDRPGACDPIFNIGENVGYLIVKKVGELKAMKAEANCELYESTIKIGGVRLTLFNIEKTTYDSWFAVQAWR